MRFSLVALSKFAILLAHVPTICFAADNHDQNLGGFLSSRSRDSHFHSKGQFQDDTALDGLSYFRSLVEDVDRKLSTTAEVPCNSVITTESVAYLQAGLSAVFADKATTYEQFPFEGAELPEAAQVIEEKIPLMEFDVQLVKVCGSCESESLDGYGCNEDDYGYGTTHSGLLLLPVTIDDDNSASIIDTADELQTWIESRSIIIAQIDSHTIIDNIGYTVLEWGLYAASMGLVSILPHKMGYGESNLAENGGPLIPSPIVKSSAATGVMPLYAKAKSIVDEMSGGTTSVGDEVYFMGYSEGGYTALAAADAFEKYGLTPVKVMAGGAPIKTRSAAPLAFLGQLLEGDFEAPFFVGLAGLAFSDTRPGLANYGQDQPFLSPEMADIYEAFFTDPNVPSPGLDFAGFNDYLFANYADIVLNAASAVDPNIFGLFYQALLAGDSDPCSNTPLEQLQLLQLDKICESLDDSDLTDVVVNATYDIELCWGDSDKRIPVTNKPDEFELKYSAVGNHDISNDVCKMKFLHGTTLQKPRLRASEPTMSPPPTAAPTAAPTVGASKSGKKAAKSSKTPKESKSTKEGKTKAPKS